MTAFSSAQRTQSAIAAPPGKPLRLERAPRESSGISSLGLLARTLASSSVPLDEILNDTVAWAAALVGCDSGVLYVAQDDELVLQAASNIPAGTVRRLGLKGGSAWEWPAEGHVPVVLLQLACRDPWCQRFNGSPEDATEVFLSFPLLSGGRMLGVLNVFSGAERSIGDQEMDALGIAAGLLAAAIDRAQLRDQNARLADQLETRKLVERAKAILERTLGLNQEDAYLKLQHESRNRRKPMKEVASAIILSDELQRSR